MNSFSDELRLLWALLLNGGMFFLAYRFSHRRGGVGRIQALCDAFLLYFLTQYAAVALPGVTGHFNFWTMSAIAVAAAVALYFAAGRRPFENKFVAQDVSRDHLGLIAATLFTAGFLGYHAYTQRALPPVATDPLVYHLPTAVQWLQTARLGIYPSWYWNPAASYSPETGSIFMAWWMALCGNDVLVRFVQVPALLFVFFLTVRICRLTGASRSISGCIGIAVALSRPLFSEAIIPKDDLYVTGFVAAGVLALAQSAPIDKSRGRAAAYAAVRVGVALGFVLASKYTVLLACPIFLFLIDAPLRAKWKPGDWLIAIAIVLVMAFPWYFRNIVMTGNPLYPVDIHLPGFTIRGLFGTERDQQLQTATGIWKMLSSTYHSLPDILIAVLILGWVVAVIMGRARAVWHDPLVRTCAVGAPMTLLLFITTSPHHEVRYIFPLIVLGFAACGFALTFAEKRCPPAAIFLAIAVAAASTFTSFSFELIATVAEYTAVAAIVAVIGSALMLLQVRVLGASRQRIALVCAAAALVLVLVIYVRWSAYVGGYRETRFFAWQQPNGYPRQAELWKWVDENIPADGSIAYANTFFVYPYYGFNFTRHVGYAPTRKGLADFAKFPRMGDRVPGDLLVQRMTEVMNADPDRKTWLQNLRGMNAGYLVVMKHDPDNPDLGIDPPELRLARAEPKVFQPVEETEAGVIYRIDWKYEGAMSAQLAQHFFISGEVQGVGYRFFAQVAAGRHQIVGTVRNLNDGRVEVFAQGSSAAMEAFRAELQKGPPSSSVEKVEASTVSINPAHHEFVILQ